MFSFESFLNLPILWFVIIATAVLLYVLLDGFDLGVGVLFPFAPSDQSRDLMMNSIAPFWDGNETWLVLGGGGLFAAFPLAYAVVMPALYIPVILMLLGLIATKQRVNPGDCGITPSTLVLWLPPLCRACFSVVSCRASR
jgi:cytochrome d ubiquinol oxidase subunit II